MLTKTKDIQHPSAGRGLMRRRRFLQAAAALGGGGVMATAAGGLPRASAKTQAGTTMQQDARPARDAARFFEDEELDFVFLNMLGGAYYQLADVGTCLAIADQITDGD